MRSYLRRKAHLEQNGLSSDSGAEAAREASPVPSYVEAPEEEDRELTPEPGPPAAVCGRKRTHWEKHYPWRFVTPRALNTRGERIFYRVDDDQDRKWAWRLERALDHHRAVHEGDMDERSDMYVKELKELSDGGLLRWRLERINELRQGSFNCTRTSTTEWATAFKGMKLYRYQHLIVIEPFATCS